MEAAGKNNVGRKMWLYSKIDAGDSIPTQYFGRGGLASLCLVTFPPFPKGRSSLTSSVNSVAS